jgi:uncharacterized protein YkwD
MGRGRPALAPLLSALLALLLPLLLLFGCADGTVKEVRPGPPLERAPALDAAKARDMINAYRASKGLAALNLDQRLTKAAMVQAEDLARRDLLDHTGSDGSGPQQRIERTGYDPALSAENIAAGQKDFQEVLSGWEDSRPHNRNLLLADAKDMGIAVAFSKDTHFRSFWALVLASPVPPEEEQTSSSNWR